MKYLFVLAHPDDETVAAGGTVRLLADSGDEVKLVTVTDGGASEKATVEVRRKELGKACKILGIKEWEVLKYKDGEINNQLVWGKLELELIDKIGVYKPDVVVTFDHSGWYFHLDHVGVSLATTRAVQKSEPQVKGLLFSLFHPQGTGKRWPYVYQEKLPVTHEVRIDKVRLIKVRALEAHKSQKIPFVDKLKQGKMNKEYFQLVLATKEGEKMFKNHKIFKEVK